MLPRSRAFISALVLVLLPALAQSETKIQRVTFEAGRAPINGSVTGYATIDYVFPAGAGESIEVSLESNKGSNYFNVNPPGSDEAMFIGASSGLSFSGVAPTSGDYTARVYLMRNEARRGTTAKYILSINVGSTNASKENGPDFADGLTGGPDYWEVTGVAQGDKLSLRTTPSPQGELVARFPNGTVLKSFGCKNTRGQRWCRVARPDDATIRGWVNGRYLREGSGPAAATPQK